MRRLSRWSLSCGRSARVSGCWRSGYAWCGRLGMNARMLWVKGWEGTRSWPLEVAWTAQQ
eukprot:357017-Chlamydomonas_euryale.AAC.6